MVGYSSVIIFFAALTALDAAAAPEKFELIGSRFFYIEKEVTLDWFSASRTCKEMNGKLATIQNQQELELIVPKLKWNSNYWLSVNDLAHEGVFTTVSGQPAPFLPWRQGEPDNYDFESHCVTLINFYIYDSSCHYKNHFICEA